MSRDMEKLAFYGALGGVLLAVLYIANKGVGGAAKDITSGIIGGVFDAVGGALAGAYEAIPEPVKPSSDQNIIYRAANKAVQVLPGSSDDETLGTWLYNITHPNEKF